MSPQVLVAWAITGSMHVVGVAMLLALYRLLRGPTVPDRILAWDTLFVAGIAQLMLFGMHLWAPRSTSRRLWSSPCSVSSAPWC